MMDRRVLVTGATGFIGGAVCRQLAAAGYTVHAVYRTAGRPPVPSLPVRTWHPHEGTDASMRRLVAEAAPEAIVHLAAHLAGPAGDGDVQALVDGNVLLGAQLLAAATATGCRHVVTTGTYWEYLAGSQAVSLYAALKQAFAHVVQYHCDAFGMRALTLALYDTYGPGDPRGKFLSLLMNAAMTGVPLDASDGLQQIDLVHVDDVARAYVEALTHVRQVPAGTHATFAVRSGQAVSLREIADAVSHTLGRPVPVRWGARARAPRTFDRPPELAALPGWQPRITLEAGIATLLAPPADA